MLVTIARPRSTDRKELVRLFRETIRDAYAKNGFPLADATEEVKYKTESFQHDLDSAGRKVFFLVAKHGGRIVGSVALKKASSFVRQNIAKQYRDWKVITSVFVKPEHQRKGIGRKLLCAAVLALMAQHQEGFVIDCGYPSAQRYWRSLLGRPDSVKRKCWYGSVDHHFWVRKIEDAPVELQCTGRHDRVASRLSSAALRKGWGKGLVT